MIARRILILTLLFGISNFATGQELTLENFSYGNNMVTWQKVFESGHSIAEMKSRVKSLPIVDIIIAEEENALTISCKRIDHDFRALGETFMSTSTWVTTKSSVGNVVFQFKEGRYRVTFTNIILEQEETVTSSSREQEGDQNPLADFALRNNRTDWTTTFQTKDHRVLDYSYSTSFDISLLKYLDKEF